MTISDKLQSSQDSSVKGLLVSSQQQVGLSGLDVAEVNPLPLVLQPFDDSQQVQLRAQILVYGSLIQGSLPEEALMFAAFANSTEVATQKTGVDVVKAERLCWEKAWQTAAERIQGNILVNAPREISQSAGLSQSTLSTLSMKTSDEGGARGVPDVSMVMSTCSGDPRNLSVLSSSLQETPGSKSHSFRTKPKNAALLGRAGDQINSSAPFISPLPPIASYSSWPARSPSIESMQNPLAGRSSQVDSQHLPPRTFFPTAQLGTFVPGSTHWLSPSLFPAARGHSPQAAGFDFSVPFAPITPFTSPELAHETANSRRSTVSSQVPFIPVMPVAPSFAPIVVGSSAVGSLNVDMGILPKSNSAPGRQDFSESRSRKRKKGNSETTMPVNVVASGGLAISRPQSSSPIGSCISAAPSLSWRCLSSYQPATSLAHGSSMPSSAAVNSLAIVAVTTQVPGPIVEAHVSKPLATQASTGLSMSGNLVSQHETGSAIEHQGRPVLPNDMMNHLEQAKASAEEASSLAASASMQSELIWTQLQSQKSSDLIFEKGFRLASSAVAMAAAASTAKAAAAAAKVAYEAALQAKLMREEAFGPTKEKNDSLCSGAGSSDNQAMQLKLSSRVEDGNENNCTVTCQIPIICNPMITKGLEMVNTSLEAATAARKRNQNLDLVVQAAELAAAAISQAGAFAAMGETIPFTLDRLVDAGPDGFHNLLNLKMPFQPHWKESENHQTNGMNSSGKGEDSFKGKGLKISTKSILSKGGELIESCSQETVEDWIQTVEPVPTDSLDALKNDKESTGIGPSDTETGKESEKTEATQPEEAAAPLCIPQDEGTIIKEAEVRTGQDTANMDADGITKGSLVEVLSNEEGLRGVWFSARVLDVENGKALVLYDDLLSDDGPGQLKEWIDLGEPVCGARGLRLAHPMTRVRFEGTRKRRRAAMGNYVWSVRDRVDAWIRDGWWEGVVLEKSEVDETKIKVFFPGEGDTAFIKSWNLRPSLIWKDGRWVLWTDSNPESDVLQEITRETPASKRQKLGKEQIDISTKSMEKGIKLISQGIERIQGQNVTMSSIEEVQPESVAKTTNNKKILANEGSKIVFGVPKPTKKRKFIEVSMHYASSRAKRSFLEGKARGKNDKVSELQLGSTGASKDDTKLKKFFHSKQPKLRSENESAERIQSKGIVNDKEKSFPGSGVNIRKDASVQDTIASGRSSTNSDRVRSKKREVPSHKHQASSHRSSSNAPTTVLKDAAVPKQSLSRSRSISSHHMVRNKKPSHIKDKQTLNSNKDPDKEKIVENSATEILEPRRSSRRKQPTSKLLEGLQSTPKLGKNVTLQEKGLTSNVKG